MQSLQLHKGYLKNKVIVPSSKSYANRALILAAISKTPKTITNLPKASDVTILLDCLSHIGLQFNQSGHTVEFRNTFPACELINPPVLSVGEGGTTARFLAGLLLLGKSRYVLKLGERLKDRPWKEFIDLVNTLGAKALLQGDELSLQGPIILQNVLEVDCAKTTQFATAFQLISPATQTKVKPLNLLSSGSYWEMTERMVKDFDKTDTYAIPSDWSSASYPMAFAALNQTIEFPGLFPDEYQADSKFYDLLKSFDCIEDTSAGLKVHEIKKHFSVNLDVSDCLDLVPTLIYFLSHVGGEHKLSGVENLVHKESDRLNETLRLASMFGRDAVTDGHSIELIGKRERISESVSLVMPDDHRMVMTGSLFLLHHAGGEIGPVEAVSKSYPGFFDIISS